MTAFHAPHGLSHPVALDAQMHEALRGLRKHATVGSRQARAALHDALRGGADPNAPDENGMSPLMFLATDPRASSKAGNCETFDSAAILLCEYGADPTREEGAFLSRSRFFRIRLCLMAIAKRQRRAGGDSGCERSPLLALGHCNPRALVSMIKTTDIPADLPMEWISARDQDGNTPLHLLWQAAFNDGTDPKPEPWAATRKLVDMGMGLDDPNDAGDRVDELIVAAFEGGHASVNVDQALLAQARALVETRRLDARTGMAAGQRPTKGRL